jgi:glucosyl-dolichyl phosphate glucuronosyltransferase
MLDILSATICICTYNRAERLSVALDALKKLKNERRIEMQILIIDNNSTDNTRETVERYSGSLPILYLFEHEQGLSHARNRALSECHADFLLFTDDDVTVDPFWLDEFIKTAQEFPEADYFGGKVIPCWSNGRPRWLKDENMALLSGLFVNYDLGTNTRLYTSNDPLPYGASFGVTRKLFEQLKPFCTKLGVKGNIPGRGEEAEYLARAMNQGFRGAYVGSALCYHWVDPIRLNLRYMYKYGVQKGIAEKLTCPVRNIKGRLFKELMYAIKGIYQLIKGRGDRFRQCIINMGIQRGHRLRE